VCVLVLPVSKLLNLKLEITTPVENVIETFIVVSVVNTEQFVFDVYSQFVCVRA
jgi:hypothetical protein